MILIVLLLCGVVAKLWFDIGALRGRLQMLEAADTPAMTRPDPYQEASAALGRQSEAEPRTTARIVYPEAPSQLPRENENPSPAQGTQATDAPSRHSRDTSRYSRDTSRHSREGGNPSPAVYLDQPSEMGPRLRGDDETKSDRAPAPVRPEPVEGPSNVTIPTRPTFSFEDILGRKLPIWAGGVTLAVCGFLIVKYSVDAGLLSPLVRVIFGLLFGAGLIAGAEAALRQEHRVKDARVRQALAGAGVATLYATVLVAANLYALVPPLVAFGGLTLVTILAAFLSNCFGAPSAVLGLVGGLAAPALVGTGEPNVPLLAAYLALAVGGLTTLGRAQRWWWLGVAALIGGFGWGATLLLNGALDVADSLSIGALLLLLGVGLPVLLFGGARGRIVRLLGTLAAAAQLAALVATGGFALLHWGLFGLLGSASVWLSRRERALADLPVAALAVALLLLFAWPQPTPHTFALVLGGAAAIFGLPAAWRVWRAEGRLSDAGTVATLATAPLALTCWHFPITDPTAALLSLAGAGAAAGIAAFGWPVASRRDDARFVLLTATAAGLLALAAAFGLPERWVAPAWATIAAGLVALATRADDRRVERFAWAMGVATATAFVLTPGRADPLGHAVGDHARALFPLEALRWAAGAVAALVFARQGRLRGSRPVGTVAAVLLGYVAVAQVVPTALLPLILAVGLAALGYWRRSDAATLTAGTLAAAWAAWPTAQWLGGGVGAVLGLPLFVTALPGPADAATRLIAPALAAAFVLWRHPPVDRRVRLGWLAGIGLLGGAAAHIAYKQLFAIPNAAAFVRLGLAERTLWEALLALAALALYRRVPAAARALGAAALAHLAWFTLLLHDPLWSEQAVGALPVANLLLPAYALGFALLWAAGRVTPPLPAAAERARGWAQMALVLLFAASELRQLIHGSFLAHGNVGETEDIARSVLAIGIAIGFLQWGIRHAKRDWRIASLLVMLGAVLKVFLLDTSGLDGLLRIASFAALGFSLIGLGWLYSRYLPDARAAVNPSSALA